MGEGTARNIILTGFSYTGKTKVGLEVAARLGWRYIDIDEEIVRYAGKPIAEIFSQDGESRFRDLEKEMLARICQEEEVVISTGGGAFIFTANREMMLESGIVVCLEAKPDTIYRRLLKDAEENLQQEVRPLLSGPEPLKDIEELKKVRQPFYALADWTVHTDNLTVDEVAEEVIRGWRYSMGEKGKKNKNKMKAKTFLRAVPDTSHWHEQGAACVVATATEGYPVFVSWGLLNELSKQMRNAGIQGNIYIISDDQVFPIHGAKVKEILEKAGFTVNSFVVPSGEGSKSFEIAVDIYNWLVKHRAERDDCIVALGGGVVGDLAGFIASTFLRGMPFVQVPTSLVGMVDSAIGGKVAINHPEGKNLIGAFYQPRLVVADIENLTTLPRRELVSGWAEVIKHALIRDPQLLEFLEERSQDLLELGKDVTTEAVAWSAAIKAGIVSEDEKESGTRTILNYGHTIAHGLEAATGYERFLHGEAVAVGMMGAARISQHIGMLSEDSVKRQEDVLRKFELPISCSGVDAESIMEAMELDKKILGRRVRWVLLEDIGRPVISGDVPDTAVETAVRELLKS